MPKSSKKRQRTSEEDAADNHDAVPPILKKSKLDSTGKAEVTKKKLKVKEPASEPAEVGEVPKPKKEKRKKEMKDKKMKSKKNKGGETVTAKQQPNDDASAEHTATASESATKHQDASETNGVSSESKDKKKQKKKKQKTSQSENPQTEGQDENEATTTNGANGTKPARFIVFVGNLPYTATSASVRTHFASLSPTSVRLLTSRDDPSKSRGMAFVEFGRYDHMKTCLEKFHHTEFDDGISPARRINVELTAGGGGKTAHRRDKIKQKNAKLNEERAQRIKKEEAAKATKDDKTQEERDEEAIHPSRRARVPYGRK